MRMPNLCGAALMASASALLVGQPAFAQSETTLGDIVVTAERRETNLQETPIAVSVVSGLDLETEQISNVLDLSTSLPNVNVNMYGGMTFIAVRGIGLTSNQPGDDPRIAFYADDVYLARPFSASSSFFDVERVEVLRGPQGTLFGRNATGGAFSVISRRPTDDPSGYLNLTLGNYDLVQVEGAIGGPIVETLSGRLAFQTRDRAGYGENIFNGEDVDDDHEYSLRGSLRWAPTDRFEANLIANYHRRDDSAGAFHVFETVTPGALLTGENFGGETIRGESRDVANDVQVENFTEIFGITGTAELDLTDAISLKTILSYQDSYHNNVYDADGTSAFMSHVTLPDDAEQHSAEVQLHGDYDRLNWTIGLFYFNEEEYAENHSILNRGLFGGPNQPVAGIWKTATLSTEAWAIYGQGTYDITDRLSLTLGVRYSSEEKLDTNDTRQADFATPYDPTAPINPLPGFPRNLAATFDSIDPRVSLQYNFADDVFAYASYTTGFKSGGYNFGSTQSNYNPEEITAYEVGLRSSWWDSRLRFNATAFRYDYTDIQQQVIQFTPVSSTNIINAAGAETTGVEVEFAALPTDSLELDATFAWLNAEFTEFVTGDPARPSLGLLDLAGNQLAQSPEYSIHLGAAYTWNLSGGELTLRGEFERIGRTYFTPYNLERDSQEPYNWVNAFLTFNSEDSHWSASLWARNLTDVYVRNGVFTQSGLFGGGGGYSQGSSSPPQTFGVTVGYNF